MTARFGVYSQATGALLSIASTRPAVNGDDYGVVDLPDEFGISLQWDAATKSLQPLVRRETVLTKAQFMRRLTPAEFSAIKAAAQVNGEIDYFLEVFRVAEEINLEDELLINGLNQIEAAGIIADGRSAELLA